MSVGHVIHNGTKLITLERVAQINIFIVSVARFFILIALPLFSPLLYCFEVTDFNQSVEHVLKVGDKGKYGQIKVDLNYRFEHVDTDSVGKSVGNASTVRSRIGYLTPTFQGLQLYAEYEGNQDFGANTYNSLRNGKTHYETVADPQQHELNRAWVNYHFFESNLKIGRQRLKLDNDRFIGNVGWRQMEQTYDAAVLTSSFFPDMDITAGYITKIQDVKSLSTEMDSQFIHVGYTAPRFGTLVGYSYWLHYNDNVADNVKSTQTHGVRFDGGYQFSDLFRALYTAEYANQSDHANNPNAIRGLDYFHLALGGSVLNVTAKVGWEQLEGREGYGFSTPLATLHAHQGWADQFLSTPSAGIRDIYGSVSTRVMGVNLMAVYHDFDDDTGQVDYGQEYDFVAIKKWGKHYQMLTKYAYYDAQTHKTDKQVLWVQVGVSF